MNAGEVLAWMTALVALPLCWLVAIRLHLLARDEPDLDVLRERASVALALAVIVTVFAGIFLNNDFPEPLLSGDATRIITRATVLVVSVVSALHWLRLYWDR